MTEPVPENKTEIQTIAIIGNGPVGIHLVNQLIQKGWKGRICIFGEEACRPYNRVQLSALLNRDISLPQIQNPLTAIENLDEFLHCRITGIDTENRLITDSEANSWHYDKLVLATGSRPHIPRIPGSELSGVYRFRDMRDVEALYARLGRTHKTVIIGGGLLGLETARAMSRFSTSVSVIQHSATLMNRQLDQEASNSIRTYAESLGIHFLLDKKVRCISGNQRVEAVELADGDRMACDTLIFATGITPNTELALQAGLKVRTGIQIDSRLCTSNPDIYAIGECADYQGQVFGLVAPGLEQASILAANLTGSNQRYRGSTLATDLKVLNLVVLSMGEVGEVYDHSGKQSLIFREDNIYRRLFLENGRLTGVIAIGHWPEYKTVQNLILKRARLFPWQTKRFTSTGNLYTQEKHSAANLPAATLVCNCQQVSVGQIRNCIGSTGSTFEEIQQTLGVATVCGTCKPLVQQLLEMDIERQPLNKTLMVLAVLALALSLVLTLSPALPFTELTTEPGWDWLWTESLPRQITGFTILGLTAASLVLSLRKRVRRIKWPAFNLWRNFHTVLALLALGMLVIHTGISFGEGINRWLITDFVLIAIVGTASALVSAMEGCWLSTRIKQLKRTLLFCHIITVWPLPVLLGFHVMSVYYF